MAYDHNGEKGNRLFILRFVKGIIRYGYIVVFLVLMFP